tara:strand:- start:7361 stop:8308 length:948 start_codon:yes stop_codon:yes gene_type:complete
MNRLFIKLINISLLLCTLFLFSVHADNSPAIDFESIMNSYFDDTTGLISFGDYRIAFAPEGKFNGFVAVLNAKGEIVAQHKFFEDYANRQGVFATIRTVGPADVTLTEPGLYTIVFVANDQPVTRFPVKLEQTSSGDDAFNPENTYRFDGYWRTRAHLTLKTYKEEPFPELTMWLGGKDLDEGSNKDLFFATLLRDGEVVAHSKRTTGFISDGHFEPKYVSFYHPHEKNKEVNAELFMLKDWTIDGSYEISVARKSDGGKIRSYDFNVTDGKIQAMAASQLGYKPNTDFILPRVQKKGATSLEMSKAIWIEDIKR